MGALYIRPPYQKVDVTVRRSPIDGFGVFALEPARKFHKIGEIRGETISVAEARRRVPATREEYDPASPPEDEDPGAPGAAREAPRP